MFAHQAMLLADQAVNAGYHTASIGGAFKTAGKVIFGILAVIFVIGALIGMLIGFFIGRAVGRKSGAPSEGALAHDPS